MEVGGADTADFDGDIDVAVLEGLELELALCEFCPLCTGKRVSERFPVAREKRREDLLL